ncbi:hypothetical protein SDC9_169399 [bioreactor metagenome]|uniref:Uncharacterized protein n=1 Tax=bioreactor metagenome TaxID=1076179 RepID=A0A645G791_9ZZZZ
MRSDGCRGAIHIVAPVLSQQLLQRCLQRLRRIQAGPVYNLNLLFTPGNLVMDRAGLGIELFDIFQPALDNARSVLGGVGVIDIQHRPVDRSHLKQIISLLDHFVVAHQVVIIEFIQGADLHVEKAAPGSRSLLDDLQILRREHNDVQVSQKIWNPRDLAAVDLNKLAALTVEAKDNLLVHRFPLYFHRHLGKWRVKPLHFFIPGGTVTPSVGTKKYCLKYIGLSLGIVSGKDVYSLDRLNIQLFIISKVF